MVAVGKTVNRDTVKVLGHAGHLEEKVMVKIKELLCILDLQYSY